MLQAEAVPVRVDNLDVVPRLFACVQLPQDSAAENYQDTELREFISK